MAWIESHSVLIDNRKLRELSALLGTKKVYLVGHLHCFWHKVIDLAEDGVITDWTPEDVAYYAQWDGDAKIFHDALLGRFIDEKKGEKVVHDWLDYAWKYLYRKYHTANPNRLKEILKTHNRIGKPKGTTKGGIQVVLPNQPNQPNLTNKQICAFFDKFWEAYPKKKSKEDARKAFFKISPDEQFLADLIAKIEQAKTSEDWTKDGGKFIPYPATWLNGKRWEDEYTPAKKQEDVWDLAMKSLNK